MNDNELIKNTNIIKFANKISPNASLVIIPVQTEYSASQNDCYNNVEQKVKKDGGNIIYGWSIYASIQNDIVIFAEAEAHAIWEDSKKNKICISPNSEKTIIFLEDLGNFIKNNYPIPNYRTSFINQYNYLKILELKDYIKILIKGNNTELIKEYDVLKKIQQLEKYPSLLNYPNSAEGLASILNYDFTYTIKI